MFSKSKITDPIEPGSQDIDAPAPRPAGSGAAGVRPSKPAPSIISQDLTIRGDLETSGDMQIEGTVEGDIRSHLLTIGQTALIRGEVIADDVVVHGRVIGRIRGEKIRLSATARVEGDILHKNIAIESGAQFEGSVQRSEDPTSNGGDNGAASPRRLPGPAEDGAEGGDDA